MKINFTVYARPEPQGSTRAFMVKGAAFPVVTSDNKKLKPYRQAVAMEAVAVMRNAGIAMIPADVPVRVTLRFYLQRPPSAPKKRREPVTKPDGDKLIRATWDALAGIVFERDQQVTQWGPGGKFYGAPERVEIEVETIEPEALAKVIAMPAPEKGMANAIAA